MRSTPFIWLHGIEHGRVRVDAQYTKGRLSGFVRMADDRKPVDIGIVRQCVANLLRRLACSLDVNHDEPTLKIKVRVEDHLMKVSQASTDDDSDCSAIGPQVKDDGVRGQRAAQRGPAIGEVHLVSGMMADHRAAGWDFILTVRPDATWKRSWWRAGR